MRKYQERYKINRTEWTMRHPSGVRGEREKQTQCTELAAGSEGGRSKVEVEDGEGAGIQICRL